MVNRIRSREALINELRAVFLSRGYEGATLAQLARACGLGKASLYHHFPGGKAEMAAVLLRDAVARLEQTTYAKLKGSKAPAVRLRRFVEGFDAYVEGGRSHCLLAVLAQGSAAEEHGELIAGQFRDWQRRLAAVFEELGQKPKRAARSAQALQAELYGYLLTAKLQNSPECFQRGTKRLKKEVAKLTA